VHIYAINKAVFQLAAEHPARRFLEAFIECRMECVGKEVEGIDQEWFSQTDLRTHRFSSFTYEHLAFDVELDGFLQNAKQTTVSELRALKAIPHMEALVEECESAASQDCNAPVVTMCKNVLKMLTLWRQYISFRLDDVE
jgi:hypothetical protein